MNASERAGAGGRATFIPAEQPPAVACDWPTALVAACPRGSDDLRSRGASERARAQAGSQGN